MRGGQRVLVEGHSLIAHSVMGDIAAFAAGDGVHQWTSSWKGALAAVGEGRVYILTGSESRSDWTQLDTLHVLSAERGQLVWSVGPVFPSGIRDDNIRAVQERDGVTYVWGNQLHALDAQTGASRWHQNVPSQSRPMFAIGADHIYLIERVPGGPSSLFAHRKDTGELAWRVASDIREVFNWLLVVDDILIVARSVVSGMQVEAWDSAEGTVKWVWPSDPSLLQADFSWRFVGTSGTIYVPIPRKSGDGIAAVQTSNGEQLWRVALPIGLGDLLAIPEI